MPFSHTGKMLRIDLSSETWQTETIPDEWVKDYLLGSGLAAKIFADELDPALDALDPDSPLLIFNGLLSGTFAPTGCRSSWCGRSPLTGIWNEANLGGHWGAELRFAGYDGLIITGRAALPSYLWLEGISRTVEIRDATHVWGKDHFDTYECLLAETDLKARCASIGQAGENLVKIAGIMQGGQSHARAAARGGMGAVMGSKNLKAIVVRGRERPEYPDKKGLRDFVKQSNRYIMKHDGGIALHLVGTAGGQNATDMFGDNAISNWRLGNWTEGSNKTSGQTIAKTIFSKHTYCYACPIGCGKAVEIAEGPYAGVWGEGPEYETLGGFGANLMCDDLNAIAAMNDRCNRYGLDTISTSAVIAFAFEAFEKGAISTAETDGLELKWGNAKAILTMIDRIAFRRDIGDTLAEGVREAARRIGNGTNAYAMHVKGLETPYHDPRGFVSMAVNYATANRGGCHMEAISYWRGYGLELPGWQEGNPEEWKDKLRFDSALGGELAYQYQNYMSVYNPLGLCKFIVKASYTPEQVAELVNRAMAWDWTAEDVLGMGERLFNLKRMINIRLGVRREHDRLPERFTSEPRPTGSAAGVLPDMELMLADYYRLRGWNEDGVPSEHSPMP